MKYYEELVEKPLAISEQEKRQMIDKMQNMVFFK